MSDTAPATVTTSDDQQGVIVQPAELADSGEPKIMVQFGTGQPLEVYTDLLLEQDDGNFKLPITLADLQQRQGSVR